MPYTKLQNELDLKSKPSQLEPVYHYFSFGETLTPRQAGLLLGTTRQTIISWIKLGECPFGKLIKNVHYWQDSRHYHIIKDRLCELSGILPKYSTNGNSTPVNI